jgi:hypothetical protein
LVLVKTQFATERKEKKEKEKKRRERIKRDPKIYITEKKDDPCSIVRKC